MRILHINRKTKLFKRKQDDLSSQSEEESTINHGVRRSLVVWFGVQVMILDVVAIIIETSSVVTIVIVVVRVLVVLMSSVVIVMRVVVIIIVVRVVI